MTGWEVRKREVRVWEKGEKGERARRTRDGPKWCVNREGKILVVVICLARKITTTSYVCRKQLGIIWCAKL